LPYLISNGTANVKRESSEPRSTQYSHSPGEAYERRRKNKLMGVLWGRMGRFNNVLFDLDGTLIDPGQGIANTIQFVLDALGSAPLDASPPWYVGPPLAEIFGRLLPPESGSRQIEHAVSLYLERFASHGARESLIYPGVAEMLAGLRGGRRLFVVTSKSTAAALQVLAAHSLMGYFEKVIGTERDGRFTKKADAVQFALVQAKMGAASTVFVGDRKHDMIAGKSNGIFSIGVSYGYGGRRELLDAGADEICDNPCQLYHLLKT
jgi:phosphoglycolate phosphatase